jgi:DNA-binding transcriptional MerR regulator
MLTIKEAAAELRVSQQWLNYWLAANPVDVAGVPFYVPMGNRKRFEPRDLDRIRDHLRALEATRLGPSVKSKVRLVGLMAQIGGGGGGYEGLLRLREEEKRKKDAEMAARVRPAAPTVRLGAEAPEQDRARYGYTDRDGNFRKIVAGLRGGQVRVTAPDGRQWTEAAKPTDPALWHRKRPFKPRTPPATE